MLRRGMLSNVLIPKCKCTVLVWYMGGITKFHSTDAYSYSHKITSFAEPICSLHSFTLACVLSELLDIAFENVLMLLYCLRICASSNGLSPVWAVRLYPLYSILNLA